MSRYATREDAVDRLLRGNVFVDLRRAVRQGLRASVESYALTRLEPFYGFERQVDLAAAIRARVRFEAWLESGNAGDRPDGPDDLRGTLARCNRDDCRSARCLADWLEACRRELEAGTGQPLPRPSATRKHATPSTSRRPRWRRSSRRSLPDCRPATPTWTTTSGHAVWLAHLLDFTGGKTSPCGGNSSSAAASRRRSMSRTARRSGG